MIADQLADLKLGELLDTPPPGLDEAVAIAKVCCAMALICAASPGHDHGSYGCKPGEVNMLVPKLAHFGCSV